MAQSITNLLVDTLQCGDYIPFLKIDTTNGEKHMHSCCNDKPFLFATMYTLDVDKIGKQYIDFSLFNAFVIFKKGTPPHSVAHIVFSKDHQLTQILSIHEETVFYFTTPNRKIVSIMTSMDLKHAGGLHNAACTPKATHTPFLLIENVLDNDLLDDITDFFNQKKNEGKLIAHKCSTKDRSHVYPNIELETRIDHKLSRSLLPEVKKIFYFDVQYRELYKICSYDSITSGKFHPHRDTIPPFQHRKYAMSLFLNDDYEGGEFVLLEYGCKIKPKANTALVFPGISTHQVLPVTKGSRMTVISFFVDGANKPQYKMKAHFFNDKNIIESNIFPITS